MLHHWLFIGNVAEHLVALMSGVASFIIATVEAVRKKPLIARWFWVLGGICLLIACDQAWQDEHRNTQVAESEKGAQVALADFCRQDKRVEDALYAGSQGMVASQRETLDRQQLSNDTQQRDVSSCVVSLGKMNPKVREEIDVIVIPYGIRDLKGNFVSQSALLKTYLSILFVTTNETELRFHGNLRCDAAFNISDFPAVPGTSQTMTVAKTPPHQISDREYEISASTEGSDWSPAHPAYLPVESQAENLGTCTFTPRG